MRPEASPAGSEGSSAAPSAVVAGSRAGPAAGAGSVPVVASVRGVRLGGVVRTFERRVLGSFGRPLRTGVDRTDRGGGRGCPALLGRATVALDGDRAEAGGLEVLAERIGVADED